jgi:hypothetical protein
MYALKYLHEKGPLYDAVLEKISVFKYPTGLSDKGVYVLYVRLFFTLL